MSDLIREVCSYSGPPSAIGRRPPPRTTVKTADKADGDQPSTEGFLASSRQEVAEALTTAGFLGFNVARCQALRRFAQSTAAGGTSDVDVTINSVRAALSKHGFCSPTSSGTEKIEMFVEPNEQPTRERDTAMNSPAAVEAARQVAAQTASQIQEQPQTAEGTQAHLSGDVAVKLLT